MTLRTRLASGDWFQGYAYAYPHKTAYRPLSPPVPLREAWAREERRSLFLYAHVPFCEMRCGFCNLFTTTHPGSTRVQNYLTALRRQARVVSAVLGPEACFARVAVGGGTPTFLEAGELTDLFSCLHESFSIAGNAPVAVEVSPHTTTPERLAVLREWGVTRVSIGIQSFVEAETRALQRAQRAEEARKALAHLRATGFPVLNVDLIYGVAGQTEASWEYSLHSALEYRPEEIFLYPLYVRPATGLDRTGTEPSDLRATLYRRGRDLLLAHGYRQISMRLFRASHHAGPGGPEYCCQEDGMIGLGAGARSYTAALHYSSEWAVGRAGIHSILDDYEKRSEEQFARADHGVWLNGAEQRRRYLIKSLLRVDGLDHRAYTARFQADVRADFPGLAELEELGAATWQGDFFRPTAEGLAWSDVIGPWLFSAQMEERMGAFALV